MSEKEVGKIYLVGTPIGNLEDITFRAIKVLKEVDLIAAEDTRYTQKLLTHFEINTPMTSFHEHNENEKSHDLIERVKGGISLALVTDAGMPGISDPGYRLVVEAWKKGIETVPIPGPTAAISALVVSGMATDRFIFEGFLPRKKSQRRKRLIELSNESRTIIFYEAPHRLIDTLEDIEQVLGHDRLVLVARELTKKYEEKVRGRVSEILDYFKDHPPRGEITFVIEGSKDKTEPEEIAVKQDMSIADELQMLIKEGFTKKEAIKKIAKERNLPKKKVYEEAIKIKC